MRRGSTILIAFIFISFNYVEAQTYEVAEIVLNNDPLVEEYFQTQGKMVQWKGLAKNQYEEQIKSMLFSFEQTEDTLYIKPANEDRSRPFKLVKTKKDLYQLSRRRDFWRVDFSKKNPVLVTGRYVPLAAPEGVDSDDYQKLKDKYGEKVEAFTAFAELREMDADRLANLMDVEKAFKVIDVSLVIHPDVIAFGKENREFFVPYTESSQSMVEETYLDQEFQVDIYYKKISIGSQNSDNSSFSFSSSLQPLDDGVYRASVGNSHWDFYVDTNSEEPFDLQKVKYFEYLELAEDDKSAKNYEELKEKYGNKLPYNVVEQVVEEVPQAK